MAALRRLARGKRLLRFPGVAVAALALLTCRDRSLTEPEAPQRAYLRVEPHLAIDPGAPLVKFSKLHVEVFQHPFGRKDVDKDTSVFFGDGETAFALDIPVTLHNPGRKFRVRLLLYDNSPVPEIVFASDDIVAATPLGQTAEPTPVGLGYVGRDRIIEIVTVAPKDTVLRVGDSFTFRKDTRAADQSAVETQVSWTSSDTNVLAIDYHTGVARPKAEGSNISIIVRTINRKADTAHVTVIEPVASVEVLPASPSVVERRAINLTASVKDRHGVSLPTRPVSWSSGNPSTATVTNGVVTGVAPGSTTITATSEGVSGSTTVTVTVPPVFKVEVSPQAPTIIVGAFVDAAARLEDDLGEVLIGRAVVWTSSTPSVASVDPTTGRITGIAAGSATITATSEEKTGTTLITVVRSASALAVANVTGVFGGTVDLSATLTAGGSPVANRSIEFSLTGTAVATATTDAGGVARIRGVSLGSIGAGVYAAGGTPPGVSASFAGDDALLPATSTGALTVTPATATLTLSGLAQSFDGTPKPVTVTTSPAGLGPVTVTYTPTGGSPSTTPPTAVGSYDVVASLNDPNYQPVQVTGVLVISPATQTISFSVNPFHTYGEPDFTISAVASSGLPVTFVVTEGPCTINGSTVTIIGAGDCMITATQPGDANYAAATPVTRPLNIWKATVMVTLSNLTQVYDGTLKTPTATWTPPVAGNVTFWCILTDGANTYPAPTLPGIYTCIGDVNSPNYYGSSGPTVFTVEKATPVLTWAAPASITAGTPLGPTQLNATATATFNGSAVEGTFTYSPVAGTVLAAGLGQTLNVTFTATAPLVWFSRLPGCAAQGMCAQGGYLRVPLFNTVTASVKIDVLAASQTITFPAIPDHTIGDAPFTIIATASSGLPMTFTSLTSGVCTVSGSTVTLVSIGSCTIQADQAGDAIFAAAAPVTQTLTVVQSLGHRTRGPQVAAGTLTVN